jgi:hypothetical protein
MIDKFSFGTITVDDQIFNNDIKIIHGTVVPDCVLGVLVCTWGRILTGCCPNPRLIIDIGIDEIEKFLI